MPAFMGTVKGTKLVYVDEKEEGQIISTHPECIVGLIAQDENPHELADALGALHGRRVRVQITLEQPELFPERAAEQTGARTAAEMAEHAADLEPMQEE